MGDTVKLPFYLLFLTGCEHGQIYMDGESSDYEL